MRRLRTVFVSLVAALVPAGCVSLTPAEEQAVAEVRAIADDTARVYGVSRISVLVGSNIDGVGGSYRRGLFTVSTPMLRSRHRDSVVAHELAHYLLGHDRPLSGALALDWQREQERRELDANAKAVEILVRVRGFREEQAMSLIYDHLLAFNRLVVAERTVIPWGHRPPCEEIADLLGRFPAHRAWTSGLPCAPAATGASAASTTAGVTTAAVITAAATAVQRPAPSAATDGNASGLLAHSYFTNRAPAAGAGAIELDPTSVPLGLGTFDRGRDGQVTLLLGVRAQGRAVRVVSRWYDETGAERRVMSRTAEPPASTDRKWTWHTHTVPMWELRPYPGHWTARVWVDGTPAGEYSFSLAR
ncbi:MAG TPA: ImmA/IrrE family metallo-endopeptidase [Methylomirabilota bacterium]